MYQNEKFSFTPQEQRAPAGDPSLYLGLARSIAVKEKATITPNLDSVKLDMVPYRKV